MCLRTLCHFSWIGDGVELKEGICNGTLKTWDPVDGGICICIEIGVMESGIHVASWYSWDIKGVMVEPVDKEDKARIDERSNDKHDE